MLDYLNPQKVNGHSSRLPTQEDIDNWNPSDDRPDPPPEPPKRSTPERFERWADDLLSRKKKHSFAHAAYGSRLKEFEIAPGHVILLAAPPAKGKTAFASQVGFDAMLAAGQENIKLLIANVEMSPESLFEREIARQTRIGKSWLAHRDFDEAAVPRLRTGIEEMRKLLPRLEFMQPPFELERLTKQAEQFDAGIVIVDYVQRMDSVFRSKDARAQVNIAMDACRRIADQDRAVIVVSAVNRQGYAKDTAGLASFRESSELEYGADSAWLLIPDEKDPRKVLLRAVKNRHGQLSEIPLLFDGATQSFTDDKADLEWNG